MRFHPRFTVCKRTLWLDTADRPADYFGLVLKADGQKGREGNGKKAVIFDVRRRLVVMWAQVSEANANAPLE